MNACKEFMQHIRKVSFKEPFLILDRDVMPQLTEYVCLIENLKFLDGAYQSYFGDVKKYITSFMSFWKFVIDDVTKEADRCANVIDRDELLVLIDRTINIQQQRQIAFGKKFLPVSSKVEKETYEDMELQYHQYMEKMHELKEKIEKFDKKEKVDDFAKNHFKITLARTTELFRTTHVFLSMMLADRVHQIRVSLEEILLRLRNNLRDMEAESQQAHISLLQLLYEKNKELLMVTRQDRRNSIEQAEADHSVEKIRAKIENRSYDLPLSWLEEEVAYWEDRLEDLKDIACQLAELKSAQDDVAKQEAEWKSMRSTDLPGSKKECWLTMGETFEKRNQYLKKKIIEVARTFMSFFSVRGVDRIYYNDNIGQYYVDEYKHKVYVYNYGMGMYHRTCDGEFIEVANDTKYYYDTFGRYVIGEDGSKVYQCAPCTSQYDLTSDLLLRKKTADCGHSEKRRQRCKMLCKYVSGMAELVPDIEPMDIKNTLDPEAVQYLWGSLGHALAPALHDVARDRTANPIQHLAHRLLAHKYNITKTELAKKMKEAHEYRENIFKERKEKAMAASTAWKAKQSRRSKPEESDDMDERVVRDALAAGAAIASTINSYYD